MKQSRLRYQTSIRVIPLLLLVWTAVSFTAAAESRKVPKSNSSAKQSAASGDWPEAFFNAAHTGYNRFETQLNRHNVGSLTQLWASVVGTGTLYTSPVVSNGKVYIGSGDGRMFAFDALTGATLWVGAQQPLYFLNSAAVGHGLVFATAFNGPVIAYDADTGEIIWSASIGASRAAPVLKGSVLYVAGTEGQVIALDARTGTVIWITPELPGVDDQAPAVSGSRVFQIRNNPRNGLSAYDITTGKQLWHQKYAVSGSVTAANNKLFVPAEPDIVALDPATGDVIWSAPRDTITFGAPAVADGLVFVGQGSGMKALNVDTGALVWTAPTYSIWCPAVANGVVYTSNLNGEWDAFDDRDGTLLWSATPSPGCGGLCANGTPAVANGILYIPDFSTLRAYSIPSR